MFFFLGGGFLECVPLACFEKNTCVVDSSIDFGFFRLLAFCFSPAAESFGVSAQIGSGVVRGGPGARFQRCEH